MNYKNEKLEEFNRFLKNQKIAIIGLGVSNMPLLDYMYDKKANVTIFVEDDENKIDKNILSTVNKYK